MTSTPIEVMNQLAERGFKNRFSFTDGKMHCIESRRDYAANELVKLGTYRFEGPSNPDDMSIVLALQAADGTRGVFMDAFGPGADAQAAAFCTEIPDETENSDIMKHLPAERTIQIASTRPSDSQPHR